MKKGILKGIFFALFAISALSITSCSKDDGGTDVCANFNCNHGTKYPNNGNCACECDPGYTGVLCTYDACTAVPCTNGTLVRGQGTCSCQCAPGFSGPDCSQSSNNCNGNNSCVNGTCLSGFCYCNDGYEGIDCAALYRDKFVRAWPGTAVCALPNNAYTVTITAGTSNTTVNVFNLRNSGLTVLASVNTINSEFLDIPNQAFGPYTITGNIELSSGILTITTSNVDGTCTFTAAQ